VLISVLSPDGSIYSCKYTNVLEIARILTQQCKQCYSDFTVGILNVLLTITSGCIDCLTYIVQLYVH
jgi:hypothetical protein